MAFWLALSGWPWRSLLPVATQRTGQLARQFGWLHRLLEEKYFMDAFNQRVFAGGAHGLGTGLWRRADQGIIDGFFVNGSARLVAVFASILRLGQTGFLYHYAIAMILGVALLLWWFAPLSVARDHAQMNTMQTMTSAGLPGFPSRSGFPFLRPCDSLSRQEGGSSGRAASRAPGGLGGLCDWIFGHAAPDCRIRPRSEGLSVRGADGLDCPVQHSVFSGIDGISLWFIPLTAADHHLRVVAAWQVIEDRIAQYMAHFSCFRG